VELEQREKKIFCPMLSGMTRVLSFTYKIWKKEQKEGSRSVTRRLGAKNPPRLAYFGGKKCLQHKNS